MDIKDKQVCIIGGGSGIGLETALWAARIPGATTATVDLANSASVEAFFSAQPALDHLLVSVSTSAPGSIATGGLDTMRRAFESKFWGACRAAVAAAPRLRPGGSIVLVSGVTSRRPVAGMTNLSPLNAAVEGLVLALAAELAPLRVNGLSPGLIDTPYWESRLDGPSRAALFASVGASLPARRVGQAADCARAVLYLWTSEWVTGTVLDVDGGFLISK